MLVLIKYIKDTVKVLAGIDEKLKRESSTDSCVMQREIDVLKEQNKSLQELLKKEINEKYILKNTLKMNELNNFSKMQILKN